MKRTQDAHKKPTPKTKPIRIKLDVELTGKLARQFQSLVTIAGPAHHRKVAEALLRMSISVLSEQARRCDEERDNVRGHITDELAAMWA